MSDDRQRKLAADCFKRGNEAMMRQKWDETCLIFRQCVNLVPDNLLYRQSLRGATQWKYGKSQLSTILTDAEYSRINSDFQKCRIEGNWLGAANACEDGLALNPWHATLNANLGEALAQLGYLQSAQFAYENAVLINRNDERSLNELSRLYELAGNYDRAIECLRRLGRLDDESMRRLDRLKRKAAGEFVEDSAEEFITEQTPEELRIAIQRYPLNYENYLTLGCMLRRFGALAEAYRILYLAHLYSGHQPWILELFEDLAQKLSAEELNQVRLRLESDPNCQSFLRKLTGKTPPRPIDPPTKQYAFRTHPEVAEHFLLALQYISEKRHREAIPLLFIARGSPELRLKSLLALGKCFVVTRQIDLAIRQFELALAEPDVNAPVNHTEEIQWYLDRLRRSSRREPPDFDPGCPVPAP